MVKVYKNDRKSLLKISNQSTRVPFWKHLDQNQNDFESQALCIFYNKFYLKRAFEWIKGQLYLSILRLQGQKQLFDNVVLIGVYKNFADFTGKHLSESLQLPEGLQLY